MRNWGWIVLALVGIAIAAAMISYQQYTPQPPAYTATTKPAAHAASPSKPAAHTPAKRFRPFYQQHRDSVLRVSDYSQRARTNRVVAVVCFLLFAFVTLPGNVRGARAFFSQLVAIRPLPVEAGEDEENNRRARKVLFFYLLFLIYQVVQFPLTWGRDNAVQFYSDLAFQAALLLGVVATYHSLARGIAERWRDDPDRRVRMAAWTEVRVEGLKVRWRDLSRLAVLMFVGTFTPALLSKLPAWLDVIASY